MADKTTNKSEREQRLNQVLTLVRQAAAAGKKLDRQRVVAKYPDLATELQSYFDTQDAQPSKFSTEATLSPAVTALPTVARPIPRVIEPTGAGEEKTVGGPGQVAHNTLPPTATWKPQLRAAEPLPGAKAIDKPGQLFGDYELLEEIARGGMGVVYKARQRKLNRIVALKMILAGQLAGQDEVQRFYTEAEAAANLDHPGIVPIYEVGEHDGKHYFSMALVNGGSLAGKIQHGSLPPQLAAEFTQKIAMAIAFAHERGVIHRDLKPGNVLLDRHGEPKVTDFGLAKKIQDDSQLTTTGQILGTPSYMPPEQAAGKIDEIGPAVDIYSLGAILYALLTGRPPFQADSPLDTLLQVLECEPASPRNINPKVPADLETICLKCLEKSPAGRYPTAQALADELGRFLRGEPILARPARVWERAIKWARRKPVIATASALVLLSVTIGIGGVSVGWRRAARSDADLQKETAISRQAKEKTLEQSKLLAQQEEEARRAREHRLTLEQLTTRQQEETQQAKELAREKAKLAADKEEEVRQAREEAAQVAAERQRDLTKIVDDQIEQLEQLQGESAAANSKTTASDAAKDREKAIRDLTKEIRLRPRNAVAYNDRAVQYENKGEHDLALKDYSAAIRIDPKYARAFNNRGWFYERKGEWNLAIKDFSEAIRLDPQFPNAWHGRGKALESKNRFDEAIKDLTEAIRLKPTNSWNYYDRSLAYHGKGDRNAAIEDLTQAIRVDPKNAKAYGQRGWIKMLKGELDAAIQDLTEAIRIDPKYSIPRNNRGWALMGAGKTSAATDLEAAINDFSEALRLNPKYDKALRNRGRAYQLKGEWEAALKDFNEAIRMAPSSAQGYQARAALLATASDRKFRDGRQALEDASEALKLSSSRGYVYQSTLAAAFAEVGKFEEAVKWQTEASAKAPKSRQADLDDRLQYYEQKKPYYEASPAFIYSTD